MWLVVLMFVMLSIFLGFWIYSFISYADEPTNRLVVSIISGIFVLMCIVGIISGFVEKEIINQNTYIKKGLFKTSKVELSKIKLVRVSYRMYYLVGHDNKTIINIHTSNTDNHVILEGFKSLGILVEPHR
jgi:hypothetical protein